MSSNSVPNGTPQGSKTLNHVTSYPAVNDAIETFKAHPIGKKSLEIADNAYQRFGKPVEPYLETPYSYAKPYVQKADELADNGLSQVDNHFPIVTKDTNTIIDTAKSYAFWPYNYTVNTYNDEYRKTASHNDRGDTLVTLVLATISFQLRVASDFFQSLADYLGPKYEESKKKGGDYIRQAQDTAEHYRHLGQDKLNEYQTYGQQKYDELTHRGQDVVNEYSKEGQQKLNEAKQQAQDAKENVKGQAQQTKEEAKTKAGQK